MDYGSPVRVFTTIRLAFSPANHYTSKSPARVRRTAQFGRSVDLSRTGPVRCGFFQAKREAE